MKQVDRLVGNGKVDVREYVCYRMPHVIGQDERAVVAMDWTDFDRDGHVAIALNLLTDPGRAIALVWRTVRKAELERHRKEFEDSV